MFGWSGGLGCSVFLQAVRSIINFEIDWVKEAINVKGGAGGGDGWVEPISM